MNVEIYKGGGGAAAATSGTYGGTIVINDGTYTTHADMGSAAVYSTGNITVNNSVLTAEAADGACVDGPASITLNNSRLSALTNHSVSFAKSPLTGIPDGTSNFTMNGGKLNSSGALFYVPNGYAIIDLNFARVNSDSGVLVTTAYSRGGLANNPARGSAFDFTAKKERLGSNII